VKLLKKIISKAIKDNFPLKKNHYNMLEEILMLRKEVINYLRTYLSEKDKYDKKSNETKVFRKMNNLRKALDNAISQLKVENTLIKKSPLTAALSHKKISIEKPKELLQSVNPAKKNVSKIQKENQTVTASVADKKKTQEKTEKVASSISASVGNKAKNIIEDTKVVQSLLNKIGAKLNVDGVCGDDTIIAIRSFQTDVLAFSKSDGRVDPDGLTFRGLLIGGKPVDNSPPSIKYSVGNKGKNKKKDVKVVQKLLNDKGAKLTVDGICGKGTIAAIKKIQKNILGYPHPDGRVDVNGKSWKAILGNIKKEEKSDNTEDKIDNSDEKTDVKTDLNVSKEQDVVPDNKTEDTPLKENVNKEIEEPLKETKKESVSDSSNDNDNWKYFSHKDWEQSKYRLGSGRTAKPLNDNAAKLLRNILAGAGLSSARVTSTLRTFSDQAYIVLTQVTQEEVNKWYSWIRKNRDIYDGYAQQLKDGVDKEKVFNEYGEWIKKNVGNAASNHLNGIALDIAGCDLEKFNKFASTLVSVSGSGVKKVFPEYKRTHVEFTFKVC
jgi:peptidoglycan hydrolase-like protein with peptidoglycan-binding domain